jgi:hypothetical protein
MEAAAVVAEPASSDNPSRWVPAYAIAHALALGAYWFVPVGSWGHSLWQAVVTSCSAAFLVLGARRLRPEGAAAWYFIAAGIFINAWGVVVELVARRFFGALTSPNAADIFWSSLFPLVAIGLGLLVRRAVAREDQGAVLLNTVICVPVTFFTGIYAWQHVAWQTTHARFDDSVAMAYKLVVTAYPFGDLIFLALLLRLVLSVGLRKVSILLMVGWWLLLLPSDLGWPTFVRTGTEPGRSSQYLMEATWMAACALMGAATWQPDVRELGRSLAGRVQPLGVFGWLTLTVCILMAPLVVLLQIVLDRLYSLGSF